MGRRREGVICTQSGDGAMEMVFFAFHTSDCCIFPSPSLVNVNIVVLLPPSPQAQSFVGVVIVIVIAIASFIHRSTTIIPTYVTAAATPTATYLIVVSLREDGLMGGSSRMGRRREGVICTQSGDGAMEMVFFEGAAHTNMQKFHAKKNKAEIGPCRCMGHHGQVLPPSNCITKITAGE